MRRQSGFCARRALNPHFGPGSMRVLTATGSWLWLSDFQTRMCVPFDTPKNGIDTPYTLLYVHAEAQVIHPHPPHGTVSMPLSLIVWIMAGSFPTEERPTYRSHLVGRGPVALPGGSVARLHGVS